MNHDKTYGIIDHSSQYHKSHIFLKTKLPIKILYLIKEKGFKKVSNYFKNKNKFLVDRNTNNVVIVSFPPGSGGNFLINCLSLSSDILNSKYPNIEDKCNYIISMYSCSKLKKSFWYDVLIGPEFTREEINDKSKYIFHLSHPFTNSNINQLFKFWIKSDKVIIFKNSTLFRGLRKFFYPRFKENIEKKSFHEKIKILKKYDINLSNYSDLPFMVKEGLQKKLNDKKNDLPQNYSYCQLENKKQIYFWDVNWFLSEEEFIFNVKMLYDAFELNGFDSNAIIMCYKNWLNCLKLLSKD